MCDTLIHENQSSCTSWALMLATQICFTAARPQSIVLISLNLLAIMQGEACATSLQLNGILFFYSVTIVVPLWLDTGFVCL